jgi:hypothetical protein
MQERTHRATIPRGTGNLSVAFEYAKILCHKFDVTVKKGNTSRAWREFAGSNEQRAGGRHKLRARFLLPDGLSIALPKAEPFAAKVLDLRREPVRDRTRDSRCRTTV